MLISTHYTIGTPLACSIYSKQSKNLKRKNRIMCPLINAYVSALANNQLDLAMLLAKLIEAGH